MLYTENVVLIKVLLISRGILCGQSDVLEPVVAKRDRNEHLCAESEPDEG